jgi:hypothetical protein
MYPLTNSSRSELSNLQHLTALTNEQIVAELGWTRKAIKAVLGVTPTTMRPPYGDIGLSLPDGSIVMY